MLLLIVYCSINKILQYLSIMKLSTVSIVVAAYTLSIFENVVLAGQVRQRIRKGKRFNSIEIRQDTAPDDLQDILQENNFWARQLDSSSFTKIPDRGSSGSSDNGDANSLCAPNDTVCVARSVCQEAYDAGHTDLETVCQWFWPQKTPSTCDPNQKYSSMQDAKNVVLSDQNRDWAHGRDPDLVFEDVIWFGEDGMYHLDCDGLYPEINAFDESDNTDPTNIVIRNWQKPPSTGTYVLPIDGSSMEIPILEMTDPKIEDYGVKLLNDKEVFQTKAMSVLGNFTYGYVNETGYYDYFSSFIWAENGEPCQVNQTSPTGSLDKDGTDGCGHGARIEQHMDGHMVSTLELYDNPITGEPIDSFFIVAKKIPSVGDGKTEPALIYDLEFAAVRLDKGKSLLVKSGTIHTNDYLSGVLQESFPTDFGGDEVFLKNLNGDPAHFCFGNYPPGKC